MVQNWHGLSSFSTHVKINIFPTRPVMRALKKSIYKKKLNKTRTTNNLIYFFSKIKTMGGCSFLIKTLAIFITIQVLHFRTYHEFMALLRFCDIHDLCNNLVYSRKMDKTDWIFQILKYIIESNLRNVKKNWMFQNATCAQSVSLIQNSEMFENVSCTQSVTVICLKMK